MTQPALRPLSMGEILDGAFGIYRQLFLPLMTVQLICSSLPFILSVYAGPMQEGNLGLIGMNYLLSFVLGALATGATSYIISESYFDRALPAVEALRRTLPRLGAIMVLSLSTGLVTVLSAVPAGILLAVGAGSLATGPSRAGLGLVAFLIGALLLLLPLFVFAGISVATPCLVLEKDSSAGQAMGRSWALTKGYRLRITGLFFVFSLILLIPMVGVGALAAVVFPKDALAGANPTAITTVSTVVGGLLAFVLTPMLYCLLTLAYYDLRVRKEGFDLEILAGALQSA